MAVSKVSLSDKNILTALSKSKNAIAEVAAIMEIGADELTFYLTGNSGSAIVSSHTSSSRSAVIYVDGASRGNPGEAGIGVAVEYEDGKRIGYYSYIGTSTNNVAEYQALLTALKIAKKNCLSTVEIFSDSQLVCHQINGVYKVKNAGLKPYYQEALDYITGFEKFSITHVRREKNKDADKLANMAIDTKQNATIELTAAARPS